MLTQIINARILTPQGWLKDGSVLIRDNKILEVTNCDLAIIGAKLIDAKGMYIVPGGVEIHVHGGGGRDFMEGTEEAFRTAIKAHMQHGTTSIFPTLSSSTIPMIRAAAATTEKMMAEPNSPVLGLHLEGHYFNMDMAGGQIPENIKDPDPEEYIPLLEETRCIKRWDAAPELPGAMQFGKYITAKGVLASVGHTQAEFEDIQTAYEAGYTHATHFYNAMPGFHKRKGKPCNGNELNSQNHRQKYNHKVHKKQNRLSHAFFHSSPYLSLNSLLILAEVMPSSSEISSSVRGSISFSTSAIRCRMVSKTSGFSAFSASS